MSNYNLTLQEIKILSALEIEEMYGYQILKEIQSKILLGSLYNSLKSMQRKGYVESKWGDETGQGGRRKYYSITALGNKILNDTRIELAPFFKLT
ncbi:PadR family transcriptional regulator [Kordia jejudonensis]|uniref:PadR family transcriptional regulator n=1 Tax=Kordia jejudonensis TaxID=1348245 RepID=UPI000629B087|nr:helix-turn-helix transcriptional regulator [Kordia jejudonensis]